MVHFLGDLLAGKLGGNFVFCAVAVTIFRILSVYLFIIIVIITITIKLTHSKTILENTVEIEPQPVVLNFKNFSQYSSRSK